MALFKYIILRDLEGVERPLVFDRDLQHSHVLPEHTIAVSAGHGVLCEGRLHVPGDRQRDLAFRPTPPGPRPPGAVSRSHPQRRRHPGAFLLRPAANDRTPMSHRDPEKKRACNRAYYQANREKLLASKRAYREANREKIRARKRARYEANREKVLAYGRAYRKANLEKVHAYERARYEANREKVIAYGRAYRKANLEKLLASKRAYREANRENVLASQRASFRRRSTDRKIMSFTKLALLLDKTL